jgi:tetraacyldisaccharide 4'-kinase
LSSALAVAAAKRLQQAWLSRGALAYALLPLAALFGAVTALRRGLYRLGWLSSWQIATPVIVVGNLVVGGAGKTPAVMSIVETLRRHGYSPGVIARGYGAKVIGALEVTRELGAEQCGDEPLLVHRRTGAPVVVGRDRVGAATQLLRTHPQVDVIVSDDGLQHLALERDAQILVFDDRGVGNGWLLPAGPLRERLPRAIPARTLVLYNAASASTPLPGPSARRSLAGVASLRDWREGLAASITLLESLRGRPLIAAAGLARPQRFFQMLIDRGLTITLLALPDHYDYATLPWPADAADVVVTEKDAIKLDPQRVGATRVWVAPLDFAFDQTFEAALVAMLPPPGCRHGNTPA